MNDLLSKAMAEPWGFAQVLTAGHILSHREDDKHIAHIGLTVNR